jgi:hypothetical protein
MRLLVHDALSCDAPDCRIAAIDIADAKADAMIVTELVFRQVAVQAA